MIKYFVAIIIVLLCACSAYNIADISNELQLHTMGVLEIPHFYKIALSISCSMAAFTPVAIYLYLFISSNMMLNFFFEEKVTRDNICLIIALAMIPMLLHLYFYG